MAKKKKLLFYIDSIGKGGGAQRVMSSLVNELSKRRYEIILVNDIKFHGEEYDIDKSIKRYYLDRRTYGGHVFKSIARILSLRKVVKREKPGVIISFLGRPNIRCLVATFGMRVCKIVSVRNDPYREYTNNKILRGIVNLLFFTADGYVFQTEDAKKYFNKRIQKKARVIANPISETFYNSTRTANDSHIILYAGRLERQKNVQMLIRAFAIASREEMGYKLRICGEGALREELGELVAKEGLMNRVVFGGYRPDIEKELVEAEIFVLSSDYEGMPNSLMEAMAVGLPCISTDCPCGGPRELSGSGALCLVPVGDTDALAYELKTFMMNENKRKDMGQKSRARAESFRLGTICDAWESYIKEVQL